MADRTVMVHDTATQQAIPVKLHDNGDGTYSYAPYGAGGGGGGGGAVTVADGADVAQGATADAAVAAGAAGSISAKARRITQQLADLLTGIVLAAGNNHVGQVGGEMGDPVSAVFVRPLNTTAYTAGDVVSNDATTTAPMSFAGMARVNAGKGYIVGARLWTNKKSITPRFRVHVFNVNNATISGDNLPGRTLYADIGKRVCSFDLAAMSTPADTTNSDMSGATDMTLRIPFKCAAASTTLYAVLEALDAFTPDSGQSFTLVLITDQN